MGQYHTLVNFDKHEIVNPHVIGNGLKMLEQIGWKYASANAMALLLAGACKGGSRGGGDFKSGENHSIVGSWAGDRVAWVGDYSERSDYPSLTDEEYTILMTDSKLENPVFYKDVSEQIKLAMEEEFKIRYIGADGWVDIEENK